MNNQPINTTLTITNKDTPINQQAFTISNKFKMQIRRKQRQNIMRKEREIYSMQFQRQIQELQRSRLEQQQKVNNDNGNGNGQSKENLVTDGQLNNIININRLDFVGQGQQISIEELQTKIKHIYNEHKTKTNYVEQLTIQQMKNILSLLVSEAGLNSVQGLTVLSTFVQYCGSYANANKARINNDGQNNNNNNNNSAKIKSAIIRKIMSQPMLVQRIFVLIDLQTRRLNHTKVKMLLFCVAKMSIVRIQSILDKQLLQKHLTQIIQNFISQSTVLIILSYISQTYPLHPQIIKLVTEQISSKEKVIKTTICRILINYLNVEKDQNNIEVVFDKVLTTLQYLYVHCKEFGERYGMALLECIGRLISLYPQGKQNELLRKISKSKIQNTMIVLLSVGNLQTKQLVYIIQQLIIDKTIHNMPQQQFFTKFSYQIICQITLGIQYTKQNIIIRCLKILNKIMHYADSKMRKKIFCENLIYPVLEDLVYSKNQGVSGLAEVLMGYYQEGKYQENEGEEGRQGWEDRGMREQF